MNPPYDNYSYIHKSIQEYFSSVFISRLADDKKLIFYNHLVSNYSEYRKWQNVTNFLSTIDVYNYSRYFLLPLRKKSIGLSDSGEVTLDYDAIKDLIGLETKVQIDENGELIEVFWGDTYSSSTLPQFIEFVRNEIINFLIAEKSSLADYLAFCELDKYENYQFSDGIFILNLIKYINNNNRKHEIVKSITTKIKNSQILSDIQEVEKELNLTEEIDREIISF